MSAKRAKKMDKNDLRPYVLEWINKGLTQKDEQSILATLTAAAISGKTQKDIIKYIDCTDEKILEDNLSEITTKFLCRVKGFPYHQNLTKLQMISKLVGGEYDTERYVASTYVRLFLSAHAISYQRDRKNAQLDNNMAATTSMTKAKGKYSYGLAMKFADPSFQPSNLLSGYFASRNRVQNTPDSIGTSSYSKHNGPSKAELCKRFSELDVSKSPFEEFYQQGDETDISGEKLLDFVIHTEKQYRKLLRAVEGVIDRHSKSKEGNPYNIHCFGKGYVGNPELYYGSIMVASMIEFCSEYDFIKLLGRNQYGNPDLVHDVHDDPRLDVVASASNVPVPMPQIITGSKRQSSELQTLGDIYVALKESNYLKKIRLCIDSLPDGDTRKENMKKKILSENKEILKQFEV